MRKSKSMPPPTEKSQPDRPLSERQRRGVARHIPLVKLTLRRHFPQRIRAAHGRDLHELFQEGCLALVQAVRSHDRRRHGPFPAYAMARIHFAVSAFAHEQAHVVRVPFIAQRRRRSRRQESAVAPPVFMRLSDALPPRRRNGRPQNSIRRAAAKPRDYATETASETIRQKLEDAFALAVAEASDAARGRADAPAIFARCLSERWLIPEPDSKTPIRRLAEELRCSVGRITHCEERVRRSVARRLGEDESLLSLTRLAKIHPAAIGRRSNRMQSAEKRAAGERERKLDPRGD
ncbi:MAG: hypothetical protein IPK83_16400 [Planctomycetes bacterium]|nr:hypothetical protein [Planctomycetota bacterium]